MRTGIVSIIINQEDEKMDTLQKEKLLRNIWILHEARWFIKCLQEFGFDVATKLNLAVARSIGKTEIKQLLAEIGHGQVKNIDDYHELMQIAADLYFPPGHKYEMDIVDKNTYRGRVIECYVYKNVSKAGTVAIHQCASKNRFDGWIEGFGMSGTITCNNNTNTCNGQCEILFHLEWK
jgi:hypothetical protein